VQRQSQVLHHALSTARLNVLEAGQLRRPVLTVRHPSGFIEPCRPPSGPLWVHEIKHDGYRLIVRRDGLRVRSFTKNGHDWANRFPAIVDAALPDF
jgi:ATP-dependent DNA ligase